jgi:transposase
MKFQGQYLTSLQRKLLLRNMRANLRPEYRLRIEVMLLADAGKSQSEICARLGCSQATARYWISMAGTGKSHLWNDRPVGRPKTISSAYIKRLAELVACDPRMYGYAFRRWTAMWLSRHLAEELGIEVTERHINRILKKLGLSTRAADHTGQTDQSDQTHEKNEQKKTEADTPIAHTRSPGIIIRDLAPDTSFSLSLNSRGFLWG